jgi:hypothetical protein
LITTSSPLFREKGCGRVPGPAGLVGAWPDRVEDPDLLLG